MRFRSDGTGDSNRGVLESVFKIAGDAKGAVVGAIRGMRSVRQLAALLGLASANLLVAQIPTGSNSATVEGLVTDIANGRPVGRAMVQLESQTERTHPPAVVTDSTGRYRIADVPPDEYHFRIEAPGYRVYGTERDPTRSPIQVRAGGAVRSDHQVSRGAAIVGRVADAAGDPVVGATIVVEYDAYTLGRRYRRKLPLLTGGTPEGGFTTDDEGRFTIRRLEEGEYYFSVLTPPASPIYYPATSDPKAAAAVRVTRQAEIGGQQIGGVNIAWRPVGKVPVRGRVEGLGGAHDVDVAVTGTGGQPLTEPVSAQVSSDGLFEVFVPPEQEYELFLSGYIAESYGAGMASVYAGSGGLDDLVMGIQAAVDIEAEFVWESFPTPDLAWDELALGLANPLAGRAGLISVTAPDEGTTKLNLAPVPRNLMLVGLPDGVYVESGLHGATDALSGEFNPADNPRAPLRIRLGNQSGVVRGTVVEPDGDPVVGAVVTLVPDADRRQRLDLFRTVASGEDGRFEFDTVVPGTYLVFAWTSIPPGAIQNEAFRLPYEPRASRVHVEHLGAADLEVDIIER